VPDQDGPTHPTEPADPHDAAAGAPDVLASLGILGHQEVAVSDHLRHLEIYTWEGLLTVLWHGDPAADRVVIACGGALGGLLGPAGLYHELGETFAAQGIATLRVGYRRPNDLDACVVDLAAAAQLATQDGGARIVTMGHSFGGAVAIQAGVLLGGRTAGVVTLATQSAGCEPGEALASNGVPVLLLHGDRDDILPFFASQMVQMICGGELVILPGASHRLSEAADELRQRLSAWIPARLAGTPKGGSVTGAGHPGDGNGGGRGDNRDGGSGGGGS
jgi:alpha-beta hydrolase superfamily lysophospholipase